MSKLILAEGETSWTSVDVGAWVGDAGDADIQRQRRIGAAVVLREMAAVLRSLAAMHGYIDPRTQEGFVLDKRFLQAAGRLEARARELDGEE